jgi:MYXO-CTERM domain-containing protein
MKAAKLTKKIWTGVVALSVASLTFAMPASAQVPDDAPDITTTTTEDDGFDWGLLGLLGLLGLAGLARRSEEPNRYRDPRTESAPPSRIDPNR